MPRSDEAQAFFHAVYAAVQEIPPGKVTSYGHIARLVGEPQRPRQVGVCLKHLPNLDEWNRVHEDEAEVPPRFHHGNVPWQRVVNAKGGISPRSQPSATLNQATALEAEGVVVTRDALGELSVDLKTYGWFPRILPSAAARGEVADDSGSE
ncbi:6-O-methylguanine DNA methyltransferase [Podospora conica]|nr:6-O-methylguanine DNA methyltransferase [Schizothecium conicum]